MESRVEKEISQINEDFLSLLVAMALENAEVSFQVVQIFAARLAQLDPAAIKRMAQRPYSLVDFCLGDLMWWRAVQGGIPPESGTAWISARFRTEAVALARRYLTLIWNTIVHEPLGSHVSLGVRPAVAEVLIQIPVKRLEVTAELHVERLSPRWPNRMAVWRRLLEAAGRNDSHEMNFVDRLGAQMLAADMMAGRR